MGFRFPRCSECKETDVTVLMRPSGRRLCMACNLDENRPTPKPVMVRLASVAELANMAADFNAALNEGGAR